MPLNTETCRKKKKATYLLLMAYYDYVKYIEYRAELRMIKVWYSTRYFGL